MEAVWDTRAGQCTMKMYCTDRQLIVASNSVSKVRRDLAAVMPSRSAISVVVDSGPQGWLWNLCGIRAGQ